MILIIDMSIFLVKDFDDLSSAFEFFFFLCKSSIRKLYSYGFFLLCLMKNKFWRYEKCKQCSMVFVGLI